MNYELRDTNWNGAPKVKEGDATKVVVPVIVTTGIVGETYGFIKLDVMIAEFPISMTGTDMQADTLVQAAAFVAATYPNTP